MFLFIYTKQCFANRKHKIYFYGIGYTSVSKSVFDFIPKSQA